MIKPEIILSLGAEDGSMTLYGVKLNEEWNFLLKHDKLIPHSIEEESIGHKTLFKQGFHNAIELLDEYTWYNFIPRSIHPEFAEQILVEVERRLDPNQVRFSYWKRLVTRSLYYYSNEIVN